MFPRSRRAIIVAAASVLLARALPASTISGTVTDADLRTPLGSMVVAAYTPTGTLVSTATTDSLGRYSVGVPAGSYRVLAYDEAGAFATSFGNDADSFETSPLVTVTGTLSGINFALQRAGTMSGTVIGRASGTPLAGITVAVYNIGSGTRRGFVQTDSRGVYSLALPPGQYKVAAYDDHGLFATRFFFEQPTFATATPVSIRAGIVTSGVNFNLDFAGHLSGTVTDVDTGVVLPGMTVSAYSPDGALIAATAVTDMGGNFTLNVPAGQYKLVVADTTGTYAAGFADDANSFAAAQSVSVKPAQLRDNLRLPLHRAGTVKGHVKDSAGASLSGITIAAYNTDGSQRTSVQTDSNGNYSLALPPGSFRIVAYDNAMIYATQFYPGRNLFRTANLFAISAGLIVTAVDFSLTRGAQFTGFVVDAATQLPVSGVSIAAYDTDGNAMTVAVTDASGKYALVLPAGTFTLVAYDPQLRYVTAYSGGALNYESSSLFQVDWGSSRRVDFALARGIRVSGRVVDASLIAISGIQIDALDVNGNRVASATSIDGTFDLMLKPNTYKLLANDPLQRFRPLFFNSASALAAATPVVVQSNGVTVPLTFILTRADRRHATPH